MLLRSNCQKDSELYEISKAKLVNFKEVSMYTQVAPIKGAGAQG